MIALVFQKQTPIPCPAADLFRWHEAPDAFAKLMPPGEPVKVLHHDGAITNGARAVLLVGAWPFRFRWELKHQDYIPGRQFCDVQVKGPFASYRHEHVMIPVDERNCLLSDRIIFSMPLGRFGAWLGRLIFLPKFERLFTFRHDVTRRAFS
jgi:ligand-binding SRPBCC domain-containing protein